VVKLAVVTGVVPCIIMMTGNADDAPAAAIQPSTSKCRGSLPAGMANTALSVEDASSASDHK
jgi:hypothetical protein